MQVEKVNAEAVVGQMLFLNQTLEPLLSYLKDQDIIKRKKIVIAHLERILNLFLTFPYTGPL